MTSLEFNHKLISLEDNMERFALSLTSNTEKAKDLLQETYLKTPTYKDKYVEVANFKSWAFTIMKNTFINNYRKYVRENTIFFKIENLSFLTNLPESQLARPDSEIASREINYEIEALDNEFKIPFRMRTEGYKYKEIAQNLNLKIGTVKSRIFFARRKLMATLNDYQ
jgi:RNA polymerase sigma factor (sigma-70 family)